MAAEEYVQKVCKKSVCRHMMQGEVGAGCPLITLVDHFNSLKKPYF